MKKLSFFIVVLAFFGLNEAMGQWSDNGSHIYNTNSGNVGIGTVSPGYLLHVSKNMVAPSIRIQNAGGIGGAAFEMIDNFSGADWKFKATNAGGFKIRDHANGLDVFFIEQNSAANLLYLKSGGNIGIGTSIPDNSALVDMTSTSKGVLLPRMTQAQIEAISSPADGLTVYCISDGKMYIFVAVLNGWMQMAYGEGIISLPFSCGDIFTRNHIEGDVAPLTKTATYGTVTGIPGEPSKCWITSNLGADHQATAVNDATEASAGWYWQFNRMQGYKHDGSIRTPNTTWIILIDENSDWIAANDPCAIELGSGWRLPTSTEWINVDASGSWTDWNGPWNSDLKLHAAGHLSYTSGSLDLIGSYGTYYSSTQISNPTAYSLMFYSSACNMGYYYKATAFSVRCLRE